MTKATKKTKDILKIFDNVADKVMLIVIKISQRAAKLAEQYGTVDSDRQSTEMYLIAVHEGIKALNLTALLKASDFDFWHDIIGIRNHLDRKKIVLKDCFLPRCARG